MGVTLMIHIDLRRDLAKAAPNLLTQNESCLYSAPCAIGAMMTPDERQSLVLDDRDGGAIDYLLKGHPNCTDPAVEAPVDQLDDITNLQIAFDSGNSATYADLHAQLTEKYA